jgi:murein DD-endopeptidase MepM/ murein hydrolase activator NlpD
MTLDFKKLKEENYLGRTMLSKFTYSREPNFIIVKTPQDNLFKKTEILISEIVSSDLNNNIERKNYTKISFISTIYFAISSAIWLALLFFKTILNKLIYSIYFIIFSILSLLSNFPTFIKMILVGFKKNIQTVTFSDTRDLWYLNLKLDIRTFFNKSVVLLSSIVYLFKKSYLLFIVFISLGMLSVGSNSVVSTQSKSFLSNFIKNNSETNSRLNSIPNQSRFNLLSVNANAASVQIITEYEVKKGDNLDKISFFYGVNKETLIINNNLNGPVAIGQKIFIPWVDGYIYKTPVDNSPEELSTLFGVDRDIIYNENVAIYSTEINKFKKDTLVLIPTKDYSQITKTLESIKNKAESERIQLEEEQKRKVILEAQSVSSKYITNSDTYVAEQKSNFGFIWPTKGTISRCYASYHKACDIANFSSPPINAAAAGMVVATYYFDVVGYGLAVVVDHGNGVKTLYAHMSEISVVKGQQVSQGQQLGIMGQTGQATGIHLHFEVVINGVQSDPLQYLP